MEEEILSVDSKTGKVKVLGMEIVANSEKLKLFVNGIDLIKNVKIESLRIVKED